MAHVVGGVIADEDLLEERQNSDIRHDVILEPTLEQLDPDLFALIRVVAGNYSADGEPGHAPWMIQLVEWRTEYDCCLYTCVQRALKWAYLFIVPMLPWPRNAEDCYCAYMVSWRSTATVRFATLTAFVFFARVVQLCTGGTPGSLGTVAFALYSLLGSFLYLGVRLGYFSIFNMRNFVYRASHLVGVLGFACVIITDSGDAGISDILALGRTEDDLVEWGTTRANILVIPIFAQLVMSLDYWVPLLGNWALLLYYHDNNFHETGFQGGITFVMIFCIEHGESAFCFTPADSTSAHQTAAQRFSLT